MCQLRPLCCERLRFAAGAVVDGEGIASLEEAACHRVSHIAKANKTNHFAHIYLLFFCLLLTALSIIMRWTMLIRTRFARNVHYIPSGAGPPIGTASRMIRSISRSVACER